jgi:hypothetical protein
LTSTIPRYSSQARILLLPFQAILVGPKPTPFIPSHSGQVKTSSFQTIPVRFKLTSSIASYSSRAKTDFLRSKHSSQAKTDFLHSKPIKSRQKRLAVFQNIPFKPQPASSVPYLQASQNRIIPFQSGQNRLPQFQTIQSDQKRFLPFHASLVRPKKHPSF